MRGLIHSIESTLFLAPYFRRITLRRVHQISSGAGLPFMLAIFSLLTVPILAISQDANKTTEAPSIVRIAPTTAAPLTRIQVEGYGLGANLTEGKRAWFVQDSNEYESVAVVVATKAPT
jgi:hypothetical protein